MSKLQEANEPEFQDGEPMNLAAAAHIARRYLARYEPSPDRAKRIVRLLNEFLPPDETLPPE